MAVTAKSVIKYATLPGIIPRARELFATGFYYVSYFMALVYGAVRLLPAGHPYTNPENIGRYGVHHVVAQAALNLRFKRENIDQIIIFGALLFGLALVAMQMFTFASMLFVQPVMAQLVPPEISTAFGDFFNPPSADQDLAGMMLDMVFGVKDIFNSCISLQTQCNDINGNALIDPIDGNGVLRELQYPFPIHYGMFAMFRIYSLALLVVAGFITLYFITTILMETAQTGTPFGKRYNKVWAPIRFLVAFGLLVPIGPGYNASQYIVLYAAKYGNQFASAGWRLFNTQLINQSLIAQEELISQPGVPEVSHLLKFMFTAKTCQFLEAVYPTDIASTQADDPSTPGIDESANSTKQVKMYIVRGPFDKPSELEVKEDTEYKDMLEFVTQGFNNSTHKVYIRFGQHHNTEFAAYKGHVKPTCGELVMPLQDPRDPDADIKDQPEAGSLIMQKYYWYLTRTLWHKALSGATAGLETFNISPTGTRTDLQPSLQLTTYYAENFPLYFAEQSGFRSDGRPGKYVNEITDFVFAADNSPPPAYANAMQQFYTGYTRSAMLAPDITGVSGAADIGNKGALDAQRETATFELQSGLLDKGWAGGAIWYNKIAELNGAMTGAVLGVPMPSKYPDVMEQVADRKAQQDKNLKPDERFNPTLADGGAIKFEQSKQTVFANILWDAFSYWENDGGAKSNETVETGNYITDSIRMLLGTEGLYNMRENPDVHPLAQLVGIGKSLIDSSIRAPIFAAGLAAGGFAFPPASGLAQVGIGFLMTITTIMITAGFVLFYVVPFMPFIYFFFAVGGWIKGIFEAMVGAPLWALAHLRIDGEGLPGKAASMGYYLILEVFLRPILIVFGLLASIVIFGALVNMLNELWDIVTVNVSGFDSDDAQSAVSNLMRGPVDQFFYTIIYAIIVYLLGMSSFKLIDTIPKSILRWMGSSANAFNDDAEDAAEGLAGKAGLVGSQVSGQVTDTLQGSLQSASSGFQTPPQFK